MVVCCAVPVAALLVFSSLNVLGSWGYYGLLLLCPVLHIIMCRMGYASHQEARQEPVEAKYPGLRGGNDHG